MAALALLVAMRLVGEPALRPNTAPPKLPVPAAVPLLAVVDAARPLPLTGLPASPRVSLAAVTLRAVPEITFRLAHAVMAAKPSRRRLRRPFGPPSARRPLQFSRRHFFPPQLLQRPM